MANFSYWKISVIPCVILKFSKVVISVNLIKFSQIKCLKSNSEVFTRILNPFTHF